MVISHARAVLNSLFAKAASSVSPSAAKTLPRAHRFTFRALWSALVGLSFVIYVLAALSLHQERTIPFVIEEEGPIQAALSHRLYGTRLGHFDTSLLPFLGHALPMTPAERLVANIAANRPAPNGSTTTMVSGGGVGAIALVQFAFSLFGAHARALILFQLLLIGLSTACFVLRYQDRRMLAAPMLLSSFTLILLSPLSTELLAEQAPVGGVRYYAIIGILPALHWCLDLFSFKLRSRGQSLLRWGYLLVQSTILGLAILVRGSPIYLIVPVIISALIAWRRGQYGDLRRATLLRVFIPLTVLFVIVGVLPRLAFPAYAKTGQLYTVIWHRAFIGYGINPNFPFAGMHEKYDCTKWIPEGLQSGLLDRNGHCVWLADPAVIKKYAGDSTLGVYSSAYEAAMRRAFFDVIRSQPSDALATFLYYKPIQTLEQVVYTLQPVVSPITRNLIPFVAIQILIIIAFVSVRPTLFLLSISVTQSLILVEFIIAAIVPQLFAWTVPATAIDLAVYVLCAGAIGLGLVVVYGVVGLRAGIGWSRRYLVAEARKRSAG